MNIRKIVIIGVLAAGLGFAGLQQASARGWGSGMGGGMGFAGDCPCLGYGPGYQQIDDATKAKLDAFRADTMEIRKQIAMKIAEKEALMSAQVPDPTAIAKVTGELFDLRTEMQSKAVAAGVPMMGGQGRADNFSGSRGPGRRTPPCYNQMGWN